MGNHSQSVKERSKKSFDVMAGNYDNTSAGIHSNKLYNMILNKINQKKFKSVLDVGCGTGTMLSMISTNDGVNLYGIDLSDEMIKIAKERLGEKTELKVGDSESLPWQDNNFDVIVCIDSFHHYPNPQKVLLEMKRVLKPNGILLIADPWLPTPVRQILNIFIPFSNDGDVWIYSNSKINKLLNKCGFNMTLWEKVDKDAFISSAIVDK